MKTQVIKTPEMALLLGQVSDNKPHSHYAIQLTIAQGQPFELKTPERSYYLEHVAIRPMVAHQLDATAPVCILLINPASPLGHFLNYHLLNDDICPIPPDWLAPLKKLTSDWAAQNLTTESVIKQFQQICLLLRSPCLVAAHHSDPRIIKALQYIEQFGEKVIPLERIAEHVALSPGRFIHLFKAQTGISYRRMQLWQRLMSSFSFVAKDRTLTELAHQSGFADSAHYSRTFKECFGLTPRQFFNNSQFIQGS